ncbi:putative outer membrane protein, partial [Caminibacter mediatlanticus TB-2]
MKKFLLIIISIAILSAYKVETKKWSKSDTFYGFLKKYSIPISLYYDLPGNIKRKVKRIRIGETIFLLTENNRLKQALIPLDDKNQLQIINKNNKYLTKIVPIIYETQKKYIEVTINNNLNYDLYKATNLRSLTNKIINIFSDKLNFRYIPKNTKIKILYEEKSRYGSVKQIKVLYASIFNKFYQYNAFLNPYDGRYYDERARSLKGMFLPAPLHYKRISSKFGMRLHPLLHKWRMHDGIDYV